MRTLVVLPILLVSLNSFGLELRPTKCLHETSSGQIKELPCTPRSKEGKVNLKGVCIYDKGWKRGNWNVKKSGNERFSPVTVCTRGVEVIEITEDTSIKGPRLSGSSLVNSPAKSSYTSSLDASSDKDYPSQVPFTCFKNQNTNTGISTSPVECARSGDTSKNQCSIVRLNDFKQSKRVYNGAWWVVYPDENKDSFIVCAGGVLMGSPSAGDIIHKKVSWDKLLNLGDKEKLKFCHVKEGNILKKRLCMPYCKNQSGNSPKSAGLAGCCAQAINENGQLTWGIQNIELKSDIVNKVLSGNLDEIKNLNLTSFSKCEEGTVSKEIVE